ncbi:hypothetical protein Tco_1099734 [Tanacetum coccineum]
MLQEAEGIKKGLSIYFDGLSKRRRHHDQFSDRNNSLFKWAKRQSSYMACDAVSWLLILLDSRRKSSRFEDNNEGSDITGWDMDSQDITEILGMRSALNMKSLIFRDYVYSHIFLIDVACLIITTARLYC